VAVVCMAQALKDVVEECVFAYVLPCKYVVHMVSCLYYTPT
jgi:hypothetical protein